MGAVYRFLHAAIAVRDLEASQHFYGEILGLPQVERSLRFPGIWYELDGVQLHLMADGPVPPENLPAEKWGRNRHLAFAVTDLAAIKATLDRHDYAYQMSASGRPALFVKDPDGNLIELAEVGEG